MFPRILSFPNNAVCVICSANWELDLRKTEENHMTLFFHVILFRDKKNTK